MVTYILIVIMYEWLMIYKDEHDHNEFIAVHK